LTSSEGGVGATKDQRDFTPAAEGRIDQQRQYKHQNPGNSNFYVMEQQPPPANYKDNGLHQRQQHCQQRMESRPSSSSTTTRSSFSVLSERAFDDAAADGNYFGMMADDLTGSMASPFPSNMAAVAPPSTGDGFYQDVYIDADPDDDGGGVLQPKNAAVERIHGFQGNYVNS
jgi:hypothetical protein